MLNKVKKGAEYVFDTYRTAFVGESLLVFTAYSLYKNHETIFNALSDLENAPMRISYCIALLGTTIAGAGMTFLQFRRRSRLEHILRERGFNEEHFTGYLKTTCDRQTAYVAAKRTGYLEEFLPLYKGLPKDHSS